MASAAAVLTQSVAMKVIELIVRRFENSTRMSSIRAAGLIATPIAVGSRVSSVFPSLGATSTGFLGVDSAAGTPDRTVGAPIKHEGGPAPGSPDVGDAHSDKRGGGAPAAWWQRVSIVVPLSLEDPSCTTNQAIRSFPPSITR